MAVIVTDGRGTELLWEAASHSAFVSLCLLSSYFSADVGFQCICPWRDTNCSSYLCSTSQSTCKNQLSCFSLSDRNQLCFYFFTIGFLFFLLVKGNGIENTGAQRHIFVEKHVIVEPKHSSAAFVDLFVIRHALMEKSGILILASEELRLLTAIFSQFVWSIYPPYLSIASGKGMSLSSKLQKNNVLPWRSKAKLREIFSWGKRKKIRGKIVKMVGSKEEIEETLSFICVPFLSPGR